MSEPIPSIVPEDRRPELTHDDLTRYSRQLLLSEIGIEGQRKLKGARVLIVGTGGLGAPLALYLAAAGVGTIGLVDFDSVDVSNLHRQIIHGTRDVGRPKVASAKDRIRALNPLVNVVTYNEPLSSENALDIIREYAGRVRGILHSCSASAEQVKEYVKMGWYISFSGVITFKNASKVLDSVLATPPSRILVETDCPYLAPVPMRGKTNHSGYMHFTAAKAASLLGMDYDAFCETEVQNAMEILSISQK